MPAPLAKILLLSHKPPWPPVDGGTFATWQLARGLAAAGHRVDILSLATSKHPPAGDPPDGLGVKQEVVSIDTSLRVPQALRSLGSEIPYPVARFESAELRERLRGRSADLAQIDGFPMALYLETLQSATRVQTIRVHNDEGSLWSQRAATTRGLRQLVLKREADRLAAFQSRSWSRVDGLIAISEQIRRRCSETSATPSFTFPVTLDVPAEPPPLPDSPSFLHLAALDWWPNRIGLEWFLASVWPAIKQRTPDATLTLAGRGTLDVPLGPDQPDVSAVGEVDDPWDEIDRHLCLVAPNQQGSGVRVKLVEAMARGRVALTTSAGHAGLEAVPGRDLLVADEPSAMARLVSDTVADRRSAARLGRSAWAHARRHHDTATLMPRLTAFYDRLLASS